MEVQGGDSGGGPQVGAEGRGGVRGSGPKVRGGAGRATPSRRRRPRGREGAAKTEGRRGVGTGQREGVGPPEEARRALARAVVPVTAPFSTDAGQAAGQESATRFGLLGP